MSPNSPSTVRDSPPFSAADGDSLSTLLTSGDIIGASGDSPELDSDPLCEQDGDTRSLVMIAVVTMQYNHSGMSKCFN